MSATPDQLTDKNLFAYCDNNPIMRVDGDGEFWNILAGAAIGAVINVGVCWGAAILSGEEYTWKDGIVDALLGAVIGGFAATGLPVYCQTLVGAGVGFLSSVGSDVINGEEINYVRAINSASAGAITGFLGGSGIRTDAAFNGVTSLWTTKFSAAMLPAVIKTSLVFATTSFLGIGAMRSYDHLNS